MATTSAEASSDVDQGNIQAKVGALGLRGIDVFKGQNICGGVSPKASHGE